MSEDVLAQEKFAPARIDIEHQCDGRMILRSPTPLQPYADHLLAHLHHWAAAAPDRTFLAQRGPDNAWQQMTYGAMLRDVRNVAQSLLERGVGKQSPVMVISDKSLESATLQLAAMYVGTPAVPISPSYSLMSSDYGRLRHIAELVEPAIIFASNGKLFEKALSSLDLSNVQLVVAQDPPAHIKATSYDELASVQATSDVDNALAKVGPDTVAKILFTSGSTGFPKGVLNTQRMLCSNQQALAQVWPFIASTPPVLLDWLPWNHTFGGNHNFNMVLRNGGTLYIDSGKPTPNLIDKTVANLREIAPTAYFNVPSGYEILLPYLENDEALRNRFFSRLELIFYAAAALPQNLWDRLEKVSLAATGRIVPMASAWGSTETAPLVTSVHYPIDRAGIIGLPVPGCELLLLPNGGKLEVRVRGPNVTPGYFKQRALFAKSIDEDGFYKIGDAVKFATPDTPANGIVFDGRIAEDFKLLTGSWVNVGKLRVNAIAAADPVIRDAVVTGHDRAEIGLLIFPDMKSAAKIAEIAPDAPTEQILASSKLHDFLQRRFREYNHKNPGSSTAIRRVSLLAEPACIDAAEITDKGYLNQRIILEKRSGEVNDLYSDSPERIIIRA
jgi:feruloyl-CoA synthase